MDREPTFGGLSDWCRPAWGGAERTLASPKHGGGGVNAPPRRYLWPIQCFPLADPCVGTRPEPAFPARCPVCDRAPRRMAGRFCPPGSALFWCDRREPAFPAIPTSGPARTSADLPRSMGGPGGNIPPAAGGWPNAGAGRLRPRIFCALPVAVVTYTIVYSISLANVLLCVILLFSSPLQFNIDP